MAETYDKLDDYFHTLKSFAILLTFARVLIFGAAYKFPQLCNAHFYNEMLLCALTAFFPRKAFEDSGFMA